MLYLRITLETNDFDYSIRWNMYFLKHELHILSKTSMEYPKLVIICQNFSFALLQLPTFEFQIVAQYFLNPVEYTSRLKSLDRKGLNPGS